MTTSTAPLRKNDSLAVSLPVANFLSFFAIAAVEFSVPFVAVDALGANSTIVALLGICRFAPQVLLAGPTARLVERFDQRAVMIGSELLRVVAFALAALGLAFAPGVGIVIFCLANISLACGSILTAVSTQVLIPQAFADEALPKIYSRLGMAESSADAVAPFVSGIGLAALGLAPTFGSAAALALAACALLVRIPRVRVPSSDASDEKAGEPGTPPAEPEEAAAAPARKSTLRDGLAVNFRTPALRTVTVWSLSYNFGQCVIEAVLLITLLRTTPLSAATFGVIRSCAVLFAVLGAYMADRLPRALRSGWGTSLFGCGAIGAYTVIGLGAYLGGTGGLVLVLAGFVMDEFCSGVVLVRVQTFRARAITDRERPMATASYRAANLTAVPAGLAVGGVAGVLMSPATLMLTIGLVMVAPAALIWSRSVRESEPATA
ncbi:MFS transporter [Streptomyces sp. NPDC052721]|uniref:MFS transporter n=1 Tax=Streptomyces sp. NPDC052721 TaxID=3154955 RepID=UPI00343B75EA